MGTATNPQIPATPCTEMAPTGSSIRMRSRANTEKTTITPPTAPIRVAVSGDGIRGSAVIETRPASAPLSTIVRSARPSTTLAVSNAATTPPAAAALVFTNTAATALASLTFEITNSDPPLNPNQPNHNINVPNVANGRLAPGNA